MDEYMKVKLYKKLKLSKMNVLLVDVCFLKTKSIHNCFNWNYITMQILL